MSMTRGAKQIMKKLAMLMTFVMLGVSFQMPLYAQPGVENENAKQAILEKEYRQVTTDGALDMLPDVTTDSAYAFIGANKQTVYEGKEEIINYAVEVGQITTSNMLEIELSYDEEQLTFIDAQIELQGNIPIQKEVKDGKFYINFGTIIPQDFNEAKKVLSVQFKTNAKLKKGEEINLYLGKCNAVAINEEDETVLHELIDKPQVVTVKVIGQETSLDINQDGKITLEDLSIAMKYYGIDETDVLWELAKKCDVTGDGRVDMADLVAISNKKET